MAVASGALGGAFGLTTLAIELPLSTIIMLRSIADIARSEGESLHDPGTAMACLEVFALGGSSKADNAAESAYYAVRAVMAMSISEAVRYVAERSVFEKGAPVLVRLLTNITPRFGLAVTQKFAAQALPVIGAFGGALVNYVFIDHFQDVARGHFTVRRLERKYGEDTVRFQYDRVRKELRG
jgi:antitoxin component of RelBE/YafQ-DinJ toxin-antitoxin module